MFCFFLRYHHTPSCKRLLRSLEYFIRGARRVVQLHSLVRLSDCLCTVDLPVQDDELRSTLFGVVPEGVVLTAFFDCSHGGTVASLQAAKAAADEDTEGARPPRPPPILNTKHGEESQMQVSCRAYIPGGWDGWGGVWDGGWGGGSALISRGNSPPPCRNLHDHVQSTYKYMHPVCVLMVNPAPDCAACGGGGTTLGRSFKPRCLSSLRAILIIIRHAGWWV